VSGLRGGRKSIRLNGGSSLTCLLQTVALKHGGRLSSPTQECTEQDK